MLRKRHGEKKKYQNSDMNEKSEFEYFTTTQNSLLMVLDGTKPAEKALSPNRYFDSSSRFEATMLSEAENPFLANIIH